MDYKLDITITEKEVPILNFLINLGKEYWEQNESKSSSMQERHDDFISLTDKISEFIHVNDLCRDPSCSYKSEERDNQVKKILEN